MDLHTELCGGRWAARVLCHYETDYLELAQISEVKHTISSMTTLIADTSNQFRGPQATYTSDQLATKSGVPTIPLGSVVW